MSKSVSVNWDSDCRKRKTCEMEEDEECCIGFELELSLCTHQFKKTCTS